MVHPLVLRNFYLNLILLKNYNKFISKIFISELSLYFIHVILFVKIMKLNCPIISHYFWMGFRSQMLWNCWNLLYLLYSRNFVFTNFSPFFTKFFLSCSSTFQIWWTDFLLYKPNFAQVKFKVIFSIICSHTFKEIIYSGLFNCVFNITIEHLLCLLGSLLCHSYKKEEISPYFFVLF